jgi:hypothetical protein
MNDVVHSRDLLTVEALMHLFRQLGDVDELFLNTKVELHGFYRSKGFEKFDGHTMRMRKTKANS